VNNDQSAKYPSPFRAMTEGTKAQWADIAQADKAYEKDTAQRVLGLMSQLRDDRHAFAIDRLEHCLQTATRAQCDGRDEEYVVCALLHDVGAGIAPQAHGEFAAAILRPYISDANHWMLQYHTVFQSYYFEHFFGGDRNKRERFRSNPHFEYTAQFCHLYDQAAFDPAYDSLPLDTFAPMVHRLFANRKR
jgi:predicted HD phosphohydrolase